MQVLFISQTGPISCKRGNFGTLQMETFIMSHTITIKASRAKDKDALYYFFRASESSQFSIYRAITITRNQVIHLPIFFMS